MTGRELSDKLNYTGMEIAVRKLALKEKLASSGIGGVYLVCSAKNEKGVNFYRKYGFKEVKKLPGSIVFGLKTGV